MKKIKEFMDKPVTWRGFVKLSVICTTISAIFSLAYVAWMFDVPSKIRGKLRKTKDVLNSSIKSKHE